MNAHYDHSMMQVSVVTACRPLGGGKLLLLCVDAYAWLADDSRAEGGVSRLVREGVYDSVGTIYDYTAANDDSPQALLGDSHDVGFW